MDLMLLRILQRQVVEQCDLTVDGLRRMNLTLVEGADDAEFWFGCQGMLTGAAILSKLLWGAGGDTPEARARADQREPLRAALRVDDTSPLRDVKMRNLFEHIDEKIFRWWADDDKHLCADRTIAPADAIGGLNDRQQFRQFDPETNTLLFWGNRFDVQAIAVEVTRLGGIARHEASKPFWDVPTTDQADG